MDPRRLLIPLLAAAALGGCAGLNSLSGPGPGLCALATPPAAAGPSGVRHGVVTGEGAPVAVPPAQRAFARMDPIPDPPPPGRAATPKRPLKAPANGPPPVAVATATAAGRPAIAAANALARAPSLAGGFRGGVQVFAYDPGRVYEVWTAPLRVTTLTLSPGETVVSKAAGDTVRWQIGETVSGAGASQRAHVMIKPLQRGLETNLVLATSQRVYFLQLRSGGAEAFNAAVGWDTGASVETAQAAPPPPSPPTAAPQALAADAPTGLLDARFRIDPRGRAPAWTPGAVMTDGTRTYLAFPPGLAATEAPALFAVGPDGERQLVNYRQQGGLWVVDRVLEAAELRLGSRHPQVVRIQRTGGAS